MVKEIKRDYYLEQLIKREGNGLIKIVTGIRRSLYQCNDRISDFA